jgi:probable F420-dependent oxidoreductase
VTVNGVRVGICAYDMPGAALLSLAVAADELGFDTLWIGEHVLLPVGFSTPHPTTGTASKQHRPGAIVKPETVLLDPLVELAAIGGSTTRIQLGTAIYILPLRHPLLTARAACTLQEVSGGRLLLGVGTGWLEEEFAALGLDFSSRVGRFDEMVQIMRRAWSGGPFSFEGAHFSFASVQTSPRPVSVPLVYGGNTDRALGRAADQADAWFASGTPSFDEALRLRDRIQALRQELDRTAPFRCFIRIDRADPDSVDRYAREGIEDVVVWADQVWQAGGDLGENRATLEKTAQALGLRTSVADR